MSRPDIKIEKITLWTSIKTYGGDDRISALDSILPALDDVEIDVLDQDSVTLELKNE